MNPDWYPEDYPYQNLSSDIATAVSEVAAEQKVLALQSNATLRETAQNTISNQNREVDWDEDLLPYINVGKFSPTFVAAVPQPKLLISDPVVDFSSVEVGSALVYKIVTIFAGDDDLTINNIFWLSTSYLHFDNPPPSAKDPRQMVPGDFNLGAVVVIPENDYRFFKVAYGPQSAGSLNESAYIVSDGVNTQPTLNIGGSSYSNVFVLSFQGTATNPPVVVPPAPTPKVVPVIPPPTPTTPPPQPEPFRGSKAVIIGGENGFTLLEDKVVEQFNFYTQIATLTANLTEERQWHASFGSIDKTFAIGGSANQRTIQTKTADVYEHYSQTLYRTVDDLNIPLDMCSGAETSYRGYTFGGDNFLGGSRFEIRETNLNANNIVLLGATLNEPRSLHQATEGDSLGSYIFGGGLRPANSSATKGFNHSIKSNITYYNYGTTAVVPNGEILNSENSFRLGSHANYQNVYLAGGGGNGSTSAAEYGGIYSERITKFSKQTELLISFSHKLGTAVDSPVGFGGNKAGYWAAGYTGTGSTSIQRIRGTKKIQKMQPLETNQTEAEFIVPFAQQLSNYHSGGATAQTENYAAGWFDDTNLYS